MNLNTDSVASPAVKRLIEEFFIRNTAIQPNNVKQLSWNDQNIFLKSTFEHPLLRKYPVNAEFSKIFLKKVISILEKEQDIHDGLYTCLCEVMNNNKTEDFCYRHYLVDNDINKIITMRETKNMVVNGTTGMKTWEAAVVLADWAISNKKNFYKKNVLELGSGIGFTSIAIAKHCDVKSIYLTDCHDDVLHTICENIEINFPEKTKSITKDITTYENGNTKGVLKLDWNIFIALPENIVPDVVIGADIVYDPSILSPLCNVFGRLFAINPKLSIYIASIIRNNETYESFLKTLDKNGYCYKIINHEQPIHLDWNSDITKCILEISKYEQCTKF